METSNTIYHKVSKYLTKDFILRNLYNRFRNEEYGYFEMSHEDLMNITNIDEYMYRLMQENTYSSPNNILGIYLNEISRQLEIQPMLLMSLPLGKLNFDTLRKYIPRVDNIYERVKLKNIEANNIYRKYMNSPHLVTTEELKKLLIYFSYIIPYKDEHMRSAQEQFAKRLLNNPPNNIDSFYITTFLIKFFGYKKCREEKLDKTKILICDMTSTTYGLSKSDPEMIVINKKMFRNVKMRNNNLRNKYEQNYEGKEILAIIHTLYHELRHQKQSQSAKNGEENDISYFMGARDIIYSMDNNFDYNKNYRCYETEKDANIKGWEEIEKLIKTYLPTHNLSRVTRNILQHKLTEELEKITGIRVSQDHKSYISTALLVQYLDKAFRDKPSILTREYPQFLKFYNSNGTPKNPVQLLTIPLVYEYKEFYFAQVQVRSRRYDYRIIGQYTDNLSRKEIQTIINNIKILMSVTESNLNKICDRVNKGQERSDGVQGNVINNFEFAVYLSNTVNRILYAHRDLYSVKNVLNNLESINQLIDMINNNTLVTKITGNRGKVSKVGRG